VRKLFNLASISLFLVSMAGCSEYSALSFKNNTTNAENVTFTDPMLQQCWADAVADAQANVLPSPLGFWTIGQITTLSCEDAGILDANDVSNASGVLALNLAGNSLGSLDLGYMPFLSELDLRGADLSTALPSVVNISGASRLTTLDLGYNGGITELDLTPHYKLQSVDLTFTNITDAVITGKGDLWFVSLSLTPLMTLDVSGSSLQIINLGGIYGGLDETSLTALDVLDTDITDLCIYIAPYEDTDCSGFDLGVPAI